MLHLATDVYRHLIHKRAPGRAARAIVPASAIRAAAEAWRARHAAVGRTDYDTPLEEVATPIEAYVNEGRWLVDCVCRNGVPVTSTAADAEGVCFTCGTIWTRIVFPPNVAQIEAVLGARRWRRNQRWTPHETVEDLQRENDAHPDGLRLPPKGARS